MSLANCTKCGEHTYVGPLHGEKGGPPFCPICAGYWHAEHTRRRKWGRIIIKAMKFYEREGGRWDDFDKLKLAASGILEDWGIDPLGYGTDTIGTEVGDITSELLADTIQLTHPDKHPVERRELAKRVTQELLALKPFVFPAPKAKSSPGLKPRDDKIKVAACGTVMEEAELKKLMEPDFTVSLRPARAPLMIIDEAAAIPGDYWTPQPAKLDRMGLISVLSNGRDIPGAILGNPPMTIAVRTK